MGDKLWESGRFCHAVAMLGENHEVAVHIFCVYGFTNARQRPEAKAANEELLQDILQYAACLGDVPCCILGDLNTNEDASQLCSQPRRAASG